MGAARGRRTGLLLIIVILVLLVGGGAAIFLLGNVGGGAQTAEPTVEPTPTTVQLIIAARDITRGTRMAISDVTTVAWPLDVPLPQGAMTAGDGVTQPGPEQVENRVARVDILAGQPVYNNMLTAADQPPSLQQSGSDAALLIPSGQVAIAVPMNRLAGVAYALRAGDHVDIAASFRFVNVDEEYQTFLPNGVGAILVPTGLTTQGTIDVAGREEDGPFGSSWVVIPNEVSPRPRQTTQLVIDNAIVLHIGDWSLTDTQVVVATEAPPADPAAAPAGEEAAAPTARPPAIPDVITLVMSRQDALVLKFTFEVGADIDFVLRSALDNNLADIETENVNLQYLLDFYNLTEPPSLPIALDPRTDRFADEPTGIFPTDSGGSGIFDFPPVIPAP